MVRNLDVPGFVKIILFVLFFKFKNHYQNFNQYMIVFVSKYTVCAQGLVETLHDFYAN